MPPPSSLRRGLSQLRANFNDILTAPRELWVIFILKFFSSYAYFSAGLCMTLFLSQEFGLSDMEAGFAYGIYGVMTTIFGIFCGWVIDFLGVRLSLLVGAAFGVVSRLILALSSSRSVVIAMLSTVIPFSDALGIPVMAIGVKRYTNHSNRTFGFSLFYAVMNIAGLLVGPLVDLSRAFFADGFQTTLPFFGPVHLTDLRLVILSSAAATASVLVISLLQMREVELNEDGSVSTFKLNRSSAVQNTWIALRDRSFWRLLVLTVLLTFVRLVFSHLDATLPKYLLRQYGNSAPFGAIFAINPFLIIFLVPLVGLLSKDVHSFPMILYGSFVAAASPFLMCIQESFFFVILFMVMLSIGEAIYSPRTYEYSLQLSKPGFEGLYTSLSTAPLFSVKLVVGIQSGWLLSTFMPEDGPHNGKLVWLFIGLTCFVSPVLMFILRDFISKENDAEDDTAVSDEVEAGPNESRKLHTSDQHDNYRTLFN